MLSPRGWIYAHGAERDADGDRLHLPPRPCGIGTFAADLRGTLTATGNGQGRRSRRGRARAVESTAAWAAGEVLPGVTRDGIEGARVPRFSRALARCRERLDFGARGEDLWRAGAFLHVAGEWRRGSFDDSRRFFTAGFASGVSEGHR